ncbi:MAG: peroxiredoxin [Thermoplasmata archaeon]|nr:peroxiredoxin [Thermoplasmata archaeon]
MLIPGELAPDFEAPTTHGAKLRLSSLRGRSVVLYFYPKAGSMGCTSESKEFAHHFPAFQDRGVDIVGVSVDSAVDQVAFASECSLPFPLVSDSDKEVARLFGVLGAFGHAKRVTFLINPDGRIREVIEAILPRPHVDRAVRAFLGGTTPHRPGDP